MTGTSSGAFNLYHLRVNSGQILHAFTDHTKILPVGARVQARVSAMEDSGAERYDIPAFLRRQAD